MHRFLARGLPVGGDLEYADQSTLLRALSLVTGVTLPAWQIGFGVERDPDFLRKAGPDWTLPLAPRRALRILLATDTALPAFSSVKAAST